MSDDDDALLGQLLGCLYDHQRAECELSTRRDEYDGYSPGWHLRHEYERCDETKKALAEALNAYIDKRVRIALEAERSDHALPSPS